MHVPDLKSNALYVPGLSSEAMGVKFLAQGNNSSRKPRPGIKPGT